jgi:hypothetical protein
MRWTRILPITLGALLAAASPAAAGTFSVTTTADTGACESTGSGTWNCGSIRSALESATELTPTEADVVEVPAGLYQLVNGPLLINSEVTLRGAGARTTTIVAASTERAIAISGATATISYLTVSGGEATPDTDFFGGNITNLGGNVLIDHVRVTAGIAYSGGGIANRNGAMTIQHSLIDHNDALLGGGDGGGVINFGGNSGAAASLVVQNSTIAFNEANLAGGVISRGNPQNSLAFESVTLARNTAATVGGVEIAFDDGGTFTARGSLFGDNIGGGAANCRGVLPTSQGGNLDSGVECGFSAPADRVGVSPALDAELSDLGGQTDVLAFAASSPAIDIGGQCSSTDQRDSLRPVGLGCDAGALEFLAGDPPPPPPPVPTPTPTPVPTATPTPIPTPTATPEAGKSVEAETIKGKVLVKVPGSDRFVPLDESVINNGAEVDTRDGVVEITRSDGQVAKFFDGIFKLTQSGGITTVTLSEKLTGCPKKGGKKASAAAKKPKTRKLWGDGKGKFRTRGQYSAATVRGTKWLVTDTCTSTITKVSQGVVSVRDEVKRKTILLRKHRTYTARPKP